MELLLICPNQADSEAFTTILSPFAGFALETVSHLLDEKIFPLLTRMSSPTLVIRAGGDNVQMFNWRKDDQACAVCLDLRIMALQSPEELAAYRRERRAIWPSKQWLTPFATEFIFSILAWLRDSDHCESRGYDLHLPTLRFRRFRIERDSGCPFCARGSTEGSATAPIQLVSRFKKSPSEYRVKHASEIVLPHDSCLNPIGGMFGAYFMQKREDLFYAPAAGSFRDATTPFQKTMWSGRKNSYASSLTIGLLEAFERHAGLKMRPGRSTVFDSYRNLKDYALDPRQCGLYSQAYYQSRCDLMPFSDDTRLRWTWGYSLTERRPLLVPVQLAFYGDITTAEPRIVHDNSNGCASGTCLEEAILFGLLELIERDAFMIQWNLRLSPPQIDTSTLIDKDLRFLIDRLTRHNFEVYLLDTRLDLGVPSIAALVVRRNNHLGTLTVATGCSFNPEEAMASALVEACGRQVGFEYRTRSSENRIREALSNFRLVQNMEDHAALYGLPEAMKYAEFLLESRVKLSVQEAYRKWRADVPQTLDLLDDIQYCIQLLASKGLKQVVAVDQSSPEGLRVGLSNARLLVPGLVPLDFGYGSSRALSLTRLHLLAQNVRPHQDQLNRAPHPFS